MGQIGERLRSLGIEIQRHLPAVGVVLQWLATGRHQLLARQLCRVQQRQQFVVRLIQEGLKQLVVTGTISVQPQRLLHILEILQVELIRCLPTTALVFSQLEDGPGLGLKLSQASKLSFSSLPLGTELQQSRIAKDACCRCGVLFTGELQHQLIGADGLKGGFGHPQTIHAPIQHRLDGFHFAIANNLDVPCRLHLHRELTATAQIEPKLQRCPDQKHPRRNGQGKNKGEPALITRHQLKPLDGPSAGQLRRSDGAE